MAELDSLSMNDMRVCAAPTSSSDANNNQLQATCASGATATGVRAFEPMDTSSSTGEICTIEMACSPHAAQANQPASAKAVLGIISSPEQQQQQQMMLASVHSEEPTSEMFSSVHSNVTVVRVGMAPKPTDIEPRGALLLSLATSLLRCTVHTSFDFSVVMLYGYCTIRRYS